MISWVGDQKSDECKFYIVNKRWFTYCVNQNCFGYSPNMVKYNIAEYWIGKILRCINILAINNKILRMGFLKTLKFCAKLI